MNIVVRPATTVDLPAIAQILSEATSRKVAYGDMAWGEGAWSNEEVAGEMARHGGYIAFLGDKPVGTFMLGTNDAAWGADAANGRYVYHLAVTSGFHGHNIGASLLDWAAQETTKAGQHYLRLDCRADNTKLCDYYKNQGFTLVVTRKHPVEDYTAAYYERTV